MKEVRIVRPIRSRLAFLRLADVSHVRGHRLTKMNWNDGQLVGKPLLVTPGSARRSAGIMKYLEESENSQIRYGSQT